MADEHKIMSAKMHEPHRVSVTAFIYDFAASRDAGAAFTLHASATRPPTPTSLRRHISGQPPEALASKTMITAVPHGRRDDRAALTLRLRQRDFLVPATCHDDILPAFRHALASWHLPRLITTTYAHMPPPPPHAARNST